MEPTRTSEFMNYLPPGHEIDPETGRLRKIETEAPVYVRDVVPINNGRSEVLVDREYLDTLVEPPLVEACKLLYDKNVTTIATSAHQNDIDLGFATIELQEEYLSPENREIANQLIQEGEARYLTNNHGEESLFLAVPLTQDSTVAEVSENALKIAQRFEKQQYSPASMWTIEQYREIVGADPSDTRWTPDLLIQRMGGYYNPKTKLFYIDPKKYEESLKNEL